MPTSISSSTPPVTPVDSAATQPAVAQADDRDRVQGAAAADRALAQAQAISDPGQVQAFSAHVQAYNAGLQQFIHATQQERQDLATAFGSGAITVDTYRADLQHLDAGVQQQAAAAQDFIGSDLYTKMATAAGDVGQWTTPTDPVGTIPAVTNDLATLDAQLANDLRGLDKRPPAPDLGPTVDGQSYPLVPGT